MAGARRLTVEILGDAKGVMSAFGLAEKGADSLGKQFTDFGKKVGIAFAGAATGLGYLAKGALDAAYESQKVAAQTEAIIKSTGEAAGLTAKQVGSLAESLSMKTGVDDEAIQTSMNMLLTFKQVRNEAGKGNDIFNRASGVMLDLANVFGSTDAAAMQLGKALSDPVKGIGALRRAGVNFTKQQQDQIKALVASGDILGAQKIILAEVESQVGGTAAATATAADRMRVAFGNLQEKAGALLIPIFERVATVLIEKVIPGIEKLAAEWGPKLRDMFQRIADAVVPVAQALWERLQPALAAIGDWIMANKDTVAVFFGILAGAAVVAGVAALAAAIASLFNPVTLIIGAIAAVAAGVYYAYTHFEGFREAVDAVADACVWLWENALVPLGHFIADAFTVWWKALVTEFKIAKAVIGTVIDVMSWLWRNILEPVGSFIGNILVGQIKAMIDIVGGIGGAFKSAFDLAKDAVKAAINFIIRGWNSLEFSIPGFDFGPIHYGGFTLGVPDIPLLAEGGIVNAPTLAVIGEAGPEAVVPLSRAGGTGLGNVTVHVEVHGSVTSERDLVNSIYDGLLRLQKRQGPLGFAA